MRKKKEPRKWIRGGALLCSLLFLIGAGCVETDGPPLQFNQQGRDGGTQTPPNCPTGAGRKAVSLDTLAAFHPCCDGRAHWLPSHLVPKDFHKMLEKHPTNNTLCVPDEFASDPNFTPKTCTSIFGLQGACISNCVPQVRDADVPLPQGDCPQGQLCSPCYDPRTFEETGACKMGLLACGPPPPHPNHGQCKDFLPTLDVSNMPKCCNTGAIQGRAHCAGPALVSEDQRQQLGKCPDGKSYCVPDDFLMRGGRYTPPKCKSVGNSEGRCLSVCIPEVRAQIDILPQSTCKPDERCSPCYDPRTDKPTGACTQGHCDPGPSTPPPNQGGQCKDLDPTFDMSKLATCCPEGRAHCAGPDLVTPDQRSRLGKCADGVSYCVPDDFLSRYGKFTPKKCTSIGKLEGRCLSVCVPEVKSQINLLPVDTCQPDERCVPCYDPRTDKDTGACTQGYCDKGPSQPPPWSGGQCKDYDPTFDVSKMPTCCPEGRAHCAGPDLVSDSQKKQLGQCSDGVSYCVPDDFLMRFGKFTPKKCTSVAGAEGRCLSVCIPQVRDQKDTLPVDVCKPDERCSPCYDPRTGQGTGACTQGYCDKGPTQPPKTFQKCGPGANGSAFCVPANMVPANERSNFDTKGCLHPNGCTDVGSLCVPKKVMDAGTSYAPRRCKNNLWSLAAAFKDLFSDPIKAFTALLSDKFKEGRCLSVCIPQVRAMASKLQKQSCDVDEVCVPCIDPTKLDQGEVRTGACDR